MGRAGGGDRVSTYHHTDSSDDGSSEASGGSDGTKSDTPMRCPDHTLYRLWYSVSHTPYSAIFAFRLWRGISVPPTACSSAFLI